MGGSGTDYLGLMNRDKQFARRAVCKIECSMHINEIVEQIVHRILIGAGRVPKLSTKRRENTPGLKLNYLVR